MHSRTDLRPAPRPPAFAVQLSGTRRGARRARQLAERRLARWGIPADHPAASAVALVTAELAANAVTHGRRPGRDFQLRLLLLPEVVRIELADTRPDLLPPAPGTATAPPPDSDGGRGLLLVEALADRWGRHVRDAHTKVVWAEVRHTPPDAAAQRTDGRAAGAGR